MELVVVDNPAALSAVGARLMADIISSLPDACLIVATGDTPMGTYQALAERRRLDSIDTSRLRVFQLDAYEGLRPDDPRSLHGWMKRSFLEPLDIPDGHVVRLPGDDPDPEAVCRRYDAAVEASGGIDLAVLGLGTNGHLGFNEPPSGPDSPTRIVDLAPASIESNARYWGSSYQVPRQALTAGMTVLLKARNTVLLVSGPRKREILRRIVKGRMSPDVPASYLHQAANVVVVADQEAAASLSSG